MIYLVEDDISIRELVVYTLKNSGFEASGFSEATAFWKAVRSKTPSLILLDIMLPGEDGLQILKKLRNMPEFSGVPVIMLTAKGTEYDKVIGLDLGADDYIPKPFGMMELISRIKALLRRSRFEPVKKNLLETNGLSVNIDMHEVACNGNPVNLTLKEFELLCYLLENKGNVLNRDKILSHVWGYDFNGETRTVDVHIRTLRQKLGTCGELIETVRGVGYRISKD